MVAPPPPPPRGRSARSVPCARAELCLFSTVPATFQQPVLATFQQPLERRQNVAGTGCWNVAGTRCVDRVGVSRASLSAGRDDRDRGPGGALAAPAPPAPSGAEGATRSEPRSSSALASLVPPPPQGAPKRPPWATPAHRPLEPPRRAPQGAAPVTPLQAHLPQLPEPSTGSSMSKGGGVGSKPWFCRSCKRRGAMSKASAAG